jgi:hypothetical protein
MWAGRTPVRPLPVLYCRRMKTLTTQTEIGPDGKLRIEIDAHLPPGPAEVVLHVQPKAAASGPPYDTLAGAYAGLLPADIDIDADLAEMNREWLATLDSEP